MTKEIRMLAAIMFTDMVGYTAMMQENERLAKRLRDKHRDVLERCVSEHRGQILQYYGDGTLVIFGSCIEAAICGMKIQKELQSEPVVPLRIGIHAGDVVYDDEGVYGDGVNVASRIENLAVPGSVLVSEKVNDELRNQKDISTIVLGAYKLKNVRYPVKIYAVKSDGVVVPSVEQVSAKTIKSDNSIAVLPFLNMSPDKENEYFSDGVTEEILNALAKVNGLMVTSRTSSFSFKGKNADIREIGNQLSVKHVLEGSVRKYGEQVRITAQLINTEDGYHKWSETYDRKLEDIFDVQDEISSTIVKHLKKTLSIEIPSTEAAKAPTNNMDAYNLYLKGMFYWNKWSPDNVQKAIKFYEKAIELEPDFVLPYTGISACNIFLGAVGVLPANAAFSTGESFGLKALQLDESIPEAHVSLAMVNYFGKWDWEESEKCFLRALDLNPNYAQAHQYYAMLLSTLGYNKKALKEIELAHQLDPLNAPIIALLAFNYFNSNMFEESLQQYESIIEIDPEFHESWSGQAWLHYSMGNQDRAIELFEEAVEIPGFRHKCLSGLGFIYAKSDLKEKAEKCFKDLEEMESNDLPLDVEKSVVYIGMNDLDKAFALLNSACDKKLSGLNFIKSRHWKDIHADKRFTQLLLRMNLPVD